MRTVIARRDKRIESVVELAQQSTAAVGIGPHPAPELADNLLRLDLSADRGLTVDRLCAPFDF